MLTYAATGHRPDKLGGYSHIPRLALTKLARSFLLSNRPSRVISGMALGWDQAWMAAALDLGIPAIAALPFVGQENRWPEHTRATYHAMLEQAAEVWVIGDGYSPQAMQKRNEWMVDNADQVIALWDGSTSGGTFNCIEYAKNRKPIWNLWQYFVTGEF